MLLVKVVETVIVFVVVSVPVVCISVTIGPGSTVVSVMIDVWVTVGMPRKEEQ